MCVFVHVGERGKWKRRLKTFKKLRSCPITSWQIDGDKVEIVTDFIFLGSKITADSDCHEIKRHFSPWKESYDKPRQCIKKKRHQFADKGLYKSKLQFFQWSCTDVRVGP